MHVLFLYEDKKQQRQAQRRIQGTEFRILPLHTYVQSGLCTNREARSIRLLNWIFQSFVLSVQFEIMAVTLQHWGQGD